jgi:glutamate dehydrogenase
MDAATDISRRERIGEIVEAAAARLPGERRGVFAAFARDWCGQLDADDVAERAVDDLAGALLSHWQLGAQRTPGTAKVRVLSPTMADHGWNARHSVVEIVNDDMPFLVDSATAEINRQGLTLHLIVHPVYAVARDAQGALSTPGAAPSLQESWMHIQVDRLVDDEQRTLLLAGIERVLADVRRATGDWPAMRAQLQAVTAELAAVPPALPVDVVAESRALLHWLSEDHFVLLGYRRHDLVLEDGEDALRLVPGSGLGVLRESDEERRSASFSALPRDARAMARAPLPLLVVTKANTRSTVHRPGYTDYIGVKRYDAAGEVVGEHRFLGLFTSSAYSARVSETPLLRGKVEAIRERAGLPPGGHRAKALAHILESYPRDELFQIGDDELYDHVLGILALGDRQRLRLFLRRDPFDRFVSCLLYVPRDAYSTDLRVRCQQVLMQAFDGTGADFDVALGEAALARIHFMVRTTPGQLPPYDHRDIERRLAAAARRWVDELRDALVEAEGEARGLELFKRWGASFPADYRGRVSARAAVADVRKIDTLTPAQPLALAMYRPLGADAQSWGFRVYRRGGAVVLSDSLPMLERMGARVLGEHNHRIDDGGTPISLHDFELCAPSADELEPPELARLFEDAFAAVFEGRLESDDFNRLVLAAGLPADEVVVLRAYARYCKQIGFALSQATIEATLAAQPHMARMLVSLFRLRFDPDRHDEAAAQSQVNAIEQALQKVSNLSEDRVLRQLLGWCRPRCAPTTGAPAPGTAARRGRGAASWPSSSTARACRGCRRRGRCTRSSSTRRASRACTCAAAGGARRAALVGPAGGLPHRGAGPGEGADGEEHRHRAGGLQGRLRAQEGAAGRRPRGLLKEGIACYQDYLRALLDLTDNLVGGAVVPPPLVRDATATTPTWWWPPTRARPASPTSPTPSVPSTATGWATPSPPAAASATTTRRWASPRAAPGRASSARSASAASTSRTPTSRWSASATCRATCSATACCCRATSGWWRPSTTATSSSTRRPTPPSPSPSASGCSRCRARHGPTTTRR